MFYDSVNGSYEEIVLFVLFIHKTGKKSII